ncbi:MAG TPA: ABC transporter ATP-binding protein [Vicinamibacterales bacterium]|nr:ABC transporter ATP-binding protein [Vicinamibacterales bacterium]
MSSERASLKHQSGPPPSIFGRPPMGGVGMPVQKARDFKGTLRRLTGYLQPHKAGLVVVIGAGVIATIFSVIGPKLLGNATTKVFEGYLGRAFGGSSGIDFAYVANILGWLVAMYVMSAAFLYLQQYLMSGIAQKTVYALRKDVEAKFSRLPLKFFDSRTHGEILSRAVNDLDNISSTLQQNLTQLISSVLMVAGIMIMMLTISWLMTLVVLLTLPLTVTIVAAIAKRSQSYFARQQKAMGEMNGHVAEMYSGHTIVTAFGHEGRSVDKFKALNTTYYEGAWRAQFATGIMFPLMMFIGNLSYVAVAVLGGILVIRRSIAIGDVQAFIQYSRQFSMPITQLSSMASTIQLTIASAERVFELLDEAEEPADAAAPKVVASPKGHVGIDRMSFSYKADAPLIEDMSIDVAPGQMVAIVGQTGAGKTTLVNLLMRFYDINSGAIRIDGVDIRDMTRGDLRRIFGMVLQDTWLFSGTIRDNIAYGKDGATEDDIVRAAKAAQADHFIRTLPENYSTVINEEATNLSQGQKQLLTIARAFLADPAILILDEATSSVDTRTEVLIQRAMAHLMRDRTTFVIAHRLSTIRNADMILMMEHGRIVEQGRHEDLLAANGRYAALYRSQFTEPISA